jgi:hypothetical protein
MLAVREATADSASVRWSPGTSPLRSGSGPLFPVQIALLGRVTDGWRVVQPLLVSIEQDGDGSWIAGDEIFAMYGLGDDATQAVTDYISVLTEYYDVLSSHPDEPSAALFRRLQTYLQPIRPRPYAIPEP